MKRLLLAISSLLLILILFTPSRVFATACCQQGCSVAPAGGCTSHGYSCGPYLCADPEPLCNTSTGQCVAEDSPECGSDGQKCCGGVCHDNLICVFQGQQYEECMTEEERCRLPGVNCGEPLIISKSDVFCDPDVGQASGVKTAIGCINTSDPNSFITVVLRLATGVGGGIALALILYGVFIVTTSAGVPDKLKMGGEIITSAVIGLIFILLSVFLVNLIGINILGIPGLT